MVRGAVDTCASVTTASYSFMRQITELYPSIVQAVYHTKDGAYMPITLSGVVKEDSAGTFCNTELPVVFNIHLPYLTTENEPSILQIACGHNVSVNLLLGLPFLQGAKAQIDLHACLINFQYLQNLQLPMEYQRCRLTPLMDITKLEAERASVHFGDYADLRHDLQALDAWFYGTAVPSHASGKRPKPDLPPGAAMVGQGISSNAAASILKPGKYSPTKQPDTIAPPTFFRKQLTLPGVIGDDRVASFGDDYIPLEGYDLAVEAEERVDPEQ